eukprot:CAMPEP_0184546596 /NCGR_PEP_ID=MMETSP0199_2-20130426/5048_1 /TAXON_ID=1112570 /ORGANISM="Thraustochytrium sp., Strain LLF1b" /LENGTH=394 /DNA_ID=CAMNT_0026941015 /DNA_START=78 /DNA_END=1258 /DNA_ORIENTATION=-
MEMEHDDTESSERVDVHVEVRMAAASAAKREEVRERVLDWFAVKQELKPGRHGGQDLNGLDPDVKEIVVDVAEPCAAWEANLIIHVFKINDQGSYDESTEDDPTSTVFTHWELPAKEFDGLWENLLFEVEVKEHLLEFATTSLLFSANCVNPNIISWNHVVLLHGPPGTGKTSLCQALAQKLSIRLDHSFARTELLEVNSHSLFSKWFSESGKLVSKLFSYVHELAEDANTLVCILIDEVESLAAARSAAVSGSEPSDSIRVVNALLTQLDRLKTRKNVIILTTSNITEAIDLAFVDRADIRQYIGLPNEKVRALILKGCIEELATVDIIQKPGLSDALDTEEMALLEECIALTEGLSGRALRKLPFQAHARFVRKKKASRRSFLKALAKAAAV